MNAFDHLMNRAKQKPVFTGSPTLAKTYINDSNVLGWFYSEKLDGVRAIWNGKNLVTRNKNHISCPSIWLTSLPKDIALDGELYIGRGKFNMVISIVRKHRPTSDWNDIKFYVFDSPTLPGTYKQRLDRLSRLDLPPFVTIVTQREVFHDTDLVSLLRTVEGLGGEGLMLRNPMSEYFQGRTGDLLKVKSFTDYDAEVVSIIPGEGKHLGRMGAIECKLLNNNTFTFNIGTGFTDKQRESPPAVGTIIRFKCMEGVTDMGVPRFPVFISERLE